MNTQHAFKAALSTISGDLRGIQVWLYINRRFSSDNRLYGDFRSAAGAATRSCKSNSNHTGYAIFENGVLKSSQLIGFDCHYAARDLRTFCDSVRERFAGWEFNEDGFRRLAPYLEPTADHLEHEAGYYTLNERGRRLGQYLKRRRTLLEAIQSVEGKAA